MRIEVVDRLRPEQVEAVRSLIAAAPDSVDNPPISEQGRLRLTEPARHLLALSDRSVLGYAQLDESEQPPSAELVAVDAAVASALLEALGPDYRLWAHGAASVAREVAEQVGLRPVRTLLQLRAELPDRSTPVAVPDGIELRAFVPGQDDQAWLAVNARAFAPHPEQGGWSRHDLDERLAADWFDPAGFLLAWRGDELVGFHWTKVHAEFEPPVGEVYVLGVDPAAQGLRLGTVLLHAGLVHLRGRGLATVLLYVEADNAAALRLYERAGFRRFAEDSQYAPGE